MNFKKIDKLVHYYDAKLAKEKVHKDLHAFEFRQDHLKESLSNFLREEFLFYYNELPELSKRLVSATQKDINLLVLRSDLLSFCENKFETLKQMCDDNVYVRKFNIDDFHEKIFTNEGRLIFADNLLEEMAVKLMDKYDFENSDFSNKIKTDPILLQNVTRTSQEVIKSFKDDALYAFTIITRLKIYKIILAELDPDNYIPTSPIEIESTPDNLPPVLGVDNGFSNNDIDENTEKNVFCTSMSLDIPKDHFKVFKEKKSENGKPFLTDKQFENFIEKAFCGNKNIELQKFNQIPKGEKILIQAVFYDFYDSYCFDYFKTGQKQDEFIKLLTDNFIGWDFEKIKKKFKPATKKRL